MIEQSAAATAVRLVECRSELLGSQHCHVGAGLMSRLGARLSAPVRVTIGRTAFLCHMWPRSDGSDQHIELDETVYCCESSVRAARPQCVSLSDIELLPDSTVFKSVSVRVVLDDHRYVARLHRDSALRDRLRAHVAHVLRDSLLSNGYTVASQQSPAGRPYGISRLVVTETRPAAQCGVVGPRTRFSVSGVVSAARDSAAAAAPFRRLAGSRRPADDLSRFLSHRLQHASRLSAAGVPPPLAVLVHGPPGCGKTSLVRAITARHSAHLITVPVATNSRPGEEESRLRELFARAVEFSAEGPCVLFLDDVDAIGAGSGREGRRVTAQLVTLLDAVQSTENLAVVGATSCLAALKPALRRAGRFEKEVFVGMPTAMEREEILVVLTEHLDLAADVDLSRLAEGTPGFVGADLENLVQQGFYAALASLDGGRYESVKPVQLSSAHIQTALHLVVPSSQRSSDCLVERPNISWHQIGGLDDVKLALQQAVEWPLLHAAAFRRLGLPRPRGVLLYGPPGCAKTTLVRAAASAAHVTFLAVSGAQLYSPCVGDSEKKIAQVFQQARAGAPCILFLDEIDSVVGTRGAGGGQRSVRERVLAALLNEMDGVGLRLDDALSTAARGQQLAEGDSGTAANGALPSESVDNRDVLVVAATNRPDMLDAALMRPGRMDRIIYVPMPDEQARRRILEVHCQKGQGVEWRVPHDELARQTAGFSGADLENLCREAALHALSVDGLDTATVNYEHFTHVLSTLQPSLTEQQLLKYAPIPTFTI